MDSIDPLTLVYDIAVRCDLQEECSALGVFGIVISLDKENSSFPVEFDFAID
jgi:hypothetical protein